MIAGKRQIGRLTLVLMAQAARRFMAQQRSRAMNEKDDLSITSLPAGGRSWPAPRIPKSASKALSTILPRADNRMHDEYI
jgi:hypothetical protein